MTIIDLTLPASLESALRTTNAIENLMGSVSHVSRNVRHWRGGQMILSWVCVTVQDAAKTFRKSVATKAWLPSSVTSVVAILWPRPPPVSPRRLLATPQTCSTAAGT